MELVAAVGVAARRLDDGALLLMRRRWEQAWGLPGGHVELGETWMEAARRECLEETGWQVRIDGLLGVYSNPNTQRHRYPSGREIHFVGVVFEATTEQFHDGRDDEASDVGFFLLSQLPEPLWPPDREVITDIASDRPRPFIR
jgi:8-oxo-dGTP diphosphatase